MSRRVRFGWVLVIASLILWPLSAVTVFAGEPQGILGLSWLAIVLTGVDILSTADVRSQQESDEP